MLCRKISFNIYEIFYLNRTFSSFVLYPVFILLLILISKPEHRCVGFISVPPDGDSSDECRPLDIQLYTWSGPGFESGECWHQGRRFKSGASWGRMDIPGAPYCVCDQGQIRIFYSKYKIERPAAVGSLTILRPTYGSSPTSHDLAKWPIQNVFQLRQRTVLCSENRTHLRVRSKDGCVVCKCSKNGHWLCRRAPSNIRHRTSQQNSYRSRNNYKSFPDSSDSVNVQLYVSTSRQQPQCRLSTLPKFCILIERLVSSSYDTKASRYIEIPRETSWTHSDTCTRCLCSPEGRLTCESLHSTCNRPCVIDKKQPVSLTYYFPSGTKWLTPPNDKCRSCTCSNGQRRCVDCDQILNINIDLNGFSSVNNQRQHAIGELSLPSSRSRANAMKPCLLQINYNSHQLIFPGQQTWVAERCYICSKRDGRLLSCR